MTTNTKKNRRRTIIAAALKTFASKGFNGASISEISKEAGVSDVTLYDYFKNKENLLFAIPEEITRKNIEAITHALTYIEGAENRIRAILLGYFRLYEENPDYTSLVLLQLRVNRNFHESDSYNLVREPARFLLNAIKEGVEAGEFRKDTDPYLVRSMLLGTIEHIFTRRHLLGGPDNISNYLQPMFEIIIKGICRQKKENQVNLNVIVPDKLMKCFFPVNDKD